MNQEKVTSYMKAMSNSNAESFDYNKSLRKLFCKDSCESPCDDLYEDYCLKLGSDHDIDKVFNYDDNCDISEITQRIPMNNIAGHKAICDYLNEQYEAKNKDYGDSFSKSVKKYGLIAALTRISDKFNRIENLILNKEQDVADEKLDDTLLDLANYCIMTVMEIENEVR